MVRTLLGIGRREATMLTYCPNRSCPDQTAQFKVPYCGTCGSERVPLIKCLCGHEGWDPKDRQRFCSACRHRWDEAYLAECMTTQLTGMVRQVSERMGCR